MYKGDSTFVIGTYDASVLSELFYKQNQRIKQQLIFVVLSVTFYCMYCNNVVFQLYTIYNCMVINVLQYLVLEFVVHVCSRVIPLIHKLG